MSVGSVLIADDEETFRESTSRLLRREGFDCDCVQDAEEAVESLRHVRYDALVSDIRMPHNQDLWLVKEARDLDTHLPIILVTGYPSADSAIRGIDMAVEAYLTKPVDMDELLALLHKSVQRSRSRRRLSTVIERLCSVVADLEVENPGPLSHNKGGTKVRWPQSVPWPPVCRTCWSYGTNRRQTTDFTISVNYWNVPRSHFTARPSCTQSTFSKRRRTTSSPSS